MTRGVARAIVRAGFGIVYGGARIGLMGILADAALDAGGEVVGIIPRALSTTELAHDGLTQLEIVESMHDRKARMADASAAFIAIPGGFGTLDELGDVLSWRQLGIHDKPVGVLNYRGYFDHLVALFDSMVSAGFVTAANRGLIVEAPSIGALLERLQLKPD